MTKRISAAFQSINLPAWAALSVLCLLAYGLLTPWLGYAYDEWHFIYYASLKGGLAGLFNYDGHPQALWFYLAGFRMLGFGPTGWHIFSLFWKIASVLMFRVVLLETWPARRWQAFAAALIFGLYPLFTLQVFPIAYSEVWFSFCLLFLSFFFTLKAVREPGRFWFWMALALLAKTGCLFTSEYTWFLELLRPALILICLPAGMSRAQKLRRAALIWLPFFALFLGSVLWRGFFYQPLRKTFQVSQGLFANPLATGLAALRYLLPDAALTLFGAWGLIIKADYFDLANRANLAALGAGLAGGLLTWLCARRAEPAPAQPVADDWPRQALVTGAIGLACGLAPAYLAGYTVYLSEWPGNARFALAAFPGAALILTALLELALRQRARLALLAVLAGLLISWQFHVGNEFRQVWELRSRFYRQLTWRAPGLKADTALVMDGPYLPALPAGSPAGLASLPDFAEAMALNAVYAAQPGPDGRIPYWYLSSPADLTPALHEQHATLNFSSDPARVLGLSFNLAGGECLRVLGPEDAANIRLPEQTRALAQRSDPGNILAQPAADRALYEAIFAPGEPSGWCYFYESGELAAQKNDWPAAAKLWKQARQAGQRAGNGRENLVFIHALLQTGDWKNAFDLTRDTKATTQGLASALCGLWLPPGAPAPTGEAVSFTAQAGEMLGCQK